MSETELIDTGSQNVTGYRKQTPEALEQVNLIKAAERDIAAMFARLLGSDVEVDPREVAEARTCFEDAFMHANRAVFRPEDPIGDAVSTGLQLRRERVRG